MAVATIAINFSTVNQVLQGTSTNTSINPAVLRTAFQTVPSTFFLSLPSLTATYFGDGSNLTGTLVKSVSGVESYLGPSIRVSTFPDTRVASVSVVPPFCPPWHIGKTGKPLLQETGANRISLQVALSAEFQRYIQYITSTNIPMVSAETLSTPVGVFSNPPTRFYGGVVLTDGRIFCVPDLSPTARIYDPRTNTLTTPNGTYPIAPIGPDRFEGGVLMSDGRVFCVPNDSTIAVIYDPEKNVLTTPNGTYYLGNGQTSDRYTGGALLRDGRVLCIPDLAACAIIYDPVTDTISTPSGTFPYIATGNGYFGGTVLFDGRVYMNLFISAGYSTGVARMYDPGTDTCTTPGGIFINPNLADLAAYGSVLLPDGRVFCPSINSIAHIYDPVTDTLSTPGPAGGFRTPSPRASLLPDGRVFIGLLSNSFSLIYDPRSNTLTTPQGTFPALPAPPLVGSHAYLPNSDIYLIPGGGTAAIIFRTYKQTPFSLAAITGPCFNNRT